jgi:hypothetical protein
MASYGPIATVEAFLKARKKRLEKLPLKSGFNKNKIESLKK